MSKDIELLSEVYQNMYSKHEDMENCPHEDGEQHVPDEDFENVVLYEDPVAMLKSLVKDVEYVLNPKNYGNMSKEIMSEFIHRVEMDMQKIVERLKNPKGVGEEESEPVLSPAQVAGRPMPAEDGEY